MKFIAAPAVALSLLSFNASAELLAGGNYYTSMSGEVTLDSEIYGEQTADIDISGIRLFIGNKNKKNNRFLVSYDSMTMEATEGTAEEDITGFSFDGEFVYGEQQVKPYWGIGLGFYNVEEATILQGTNKAGDDVSAVSFQIALGAKVELDRNLELDLAFRRQALVLQQVEYYEIGVFGGQTETLDTTYTHNSLTIGLAAFF